MSISTSTITATPTVGAATGSLRRTTVVAGVLAAAAATAVAAAAHGAGVSLAVRDGDIPLAGFAQMAFLGAVLGGVILAGINRHSTGARRRFLQTTVALTALSCVPSVALAPAVATKLTLVVTHVIAAAIVVPALVRHAR